MTTEQISVSDATAPTDRTSDSREFAPTSWPAGVEQVARGIFRIRDTCNVYLIISDGPRNGLRTAVTIDFGSGLVLDVLDRLGVDQVTDVLMTHHHRDQGQGLPRAVQHGARIQVPQVEADLFADVEEHWAMRRLANDYNLRQDRFSLLESVPVAGTVPEYREADFGGVRLRTIPTPGHTPGSVSYLLDRDGERLAFTGDLIYGPGKVWSMAATQWTYTGLEGPAMTGLSCYLLGDEEPDVLLPSHGRPMHDPRTALGLLAGRMQRLVDTRSPWPWRLESYLRDPYERVTDHLLMNKSSNSYSYVLLSRTGEALFVDYGYDMTTGLPAGQDRAGRRPWLASLPALEQNYGVTRVTVALPTHYHDDHVAGMPLLRDVEGTEIWAPSTVAPIMADPMLEDLPCQWYEPIAADRVLPVGESFRWNEYTITVHDQPGHTLYHVAYEVEVDGVRVLFTGDQQENLGIPGKRKEVLNYQYRNRFRVDDYVRSAKLYRNIRPAVMLSGHWNPTWVEEGYLQFLLFAGEDLAQMHRDLLPLDELDLGADGVLARLAPYRATVRAGTQHVLTASVRNPFDTETEARLGLVPPSDWAPPDPVRVRLGAHQELSVRLPVVVGGPARRARVALELTIGDLRLGQHTDAVVEVL